MSHRNRPREVVNIRSEINSIRAGPGCSAAIGSDGTLWLWGSNEYNRLGLDREGLFCLRRTVGQVGVPTRTRRNRTQDVAFGDKHTMVITTAGEAVHLNGPNAGHVVAFHGPVQVYVLLFRCNSRDEKNDA
jgi:alpha-tubulin suppressor-like RCC1 family protein